MAAKQCISQYDNLLMGESKMFDPSKFALPHPLRRLQERLCSMMSAEEFQKIRMAVVRDTLVIGFRGDSGRAVTIEEEQGLRGPYSLCGYPVSGKAVFDSMKAGKGCPPNDSGGPVIGLSEYDLIDQIKLELF